MSNIKTYTKKERNMYLVGMFGQNMIYNIIATGLVSYYLQYVIYVPVVAIGWIVMIARVWDAVNDPMMGTIVDKTRTKWGKCRPYLIFGPPVIGIVTILTFINGNYTAASSTGKVLIVAWAAVSYILWGMVFTVCDIPLWGITSLMTESEEDRSKILGYARVAAGVGGIGVLVVQIAQVLASVFEGQGYDTDTANQYGFIVTVIILTVLSTICFELAGIGTRERVQSTEEKRSFKDSFKIMWTCKPFRQILISGILRSPIQLLMLIAMSFVTYYYANGNFMNLFTDDGINFTMLISIAIIAVGIFAGQFVAMAVTPAISKKVENKKLYNFYTIGGAIPFALLFVIYVIANGDLTPIGWVIITGVLFMFASAGMGGVNVMQSVMIADCVDYEEYHTGIRPDGVFFSGQSFITKLSGGIAAIIQSIVYGAIGFSDANIEIMNNELSDTVSFVTYNDGIYAAAMFFLISIPPAIGMLLAAIPTKNYALSDAEHERILGELVLKHEQDRIDAGTASEESDAEAEAENNANDA